MQTSIRVVLMMGAVLSLGAASAAWGAGGGGGGGAEMPSASAPAYDPAAEYAKGVAALKAGDYKSAARALSHVTEIVPTNGEAWRLLGLAKAGSADWKGAKRAYERAVRYDPENIEAHRGYGISLASLKDAKAQGQLEWLNTKVQACGTCVDADKLKDAAGAVAKALGAAPSAALSPGLMLFSGPQAGDAAYVQAVSLINDHRYDEALKSLDLAREAFGPHPDILTYQGFTWRKKGAFDLAESYYQQALAIAPKHRGATEYYGELKVERGDMAGAKLMLAKLDAICAFGCAEAEELRRWVDAGHEPGR